MADSPDPQTSSPGPSSSAAAAAAAETSSSNADAGASASASSRATPPAVPKYVPRKGHKKSRTGCRTCKTRKIKCDERRPACLNCISHGVRCPYLGTQTPPREPVGGNTSTFTTGSDPPGSDARRPAFEPEAHLTSFHLQPYPPPGLSIHTSPSPIAYTEPYRPTSWPSLQLELLHHFTFTTYSTFAHDSAVHDFHRITLVQLGLKCAYLMQALLSVSALHLAACTTGSAKRDHYMAHGIELHRQASRGAVQYMNRVDLDTEEMINLFLFSLLTVHFALASHPDHTSSTVPTVPTPAPTRNSPFPDWVFLLNGAKSLAAILGHQAAGHPALATYRNHGQRWALARRRILGKYFPERTDAATCGVFCMIVDPTSNTTSSTRPHHGLNPHASTTPISIQGRFLPTSLEATSIRQLRRRVLESISLKQVRPSPNPTVERTSFAPESSSPMDVDPSSASADTERLKEIYTHALDELDLSFAYTTTHLRPLNPQDTLLFLWEVSDSLIPLLQDPSPPQEAVAIFAHFAILLKMYEEEGHVWWIRGWPRHIVRQAHGVLDEVHKPWIAWPMREVGLDFDFTGRPGGLGNTMFISLV